MLLNRSGVDGVNMSLVVSRLDIEKSDTLYEQLKLQMVKRMGDEPGEATGYEMWLNWKLDTSTNMSDIFNQYE